MMTLPVNCTAIPEEEMTYVEGGAMIDVFNLVIGNYLRDTLVMGGVRGALWNSIKQGSFAPIVSWYQSIEDMSLLGHFAFFIGCIMAYNQLKAAYNK